jgi:hypothetical protein
MCGPDILLLIFPSWFDLSASNLPSADQISTCKSPRAPWSTIGQGVMASWLWLQLLWSNMKLSFTGRLRLQRGFVASFLHHCLLWSMKDFCLHMVLLGFYFHELSGARLAFICNMHELPVISYIVWSHPVYKRFNFKRIYLHLDLSCYICCRVYLRYQFSFLFLARWIA